MTSKASRCEGSRAGGREVELASWLTPWQRYFDASWDNRLVVGYFSSIKRMHSCVHQNNLATIIDDVEIRQNGLNLAFDSTSE